MSSFLTVFKFTYKDALRKKSFKVSTIIILFIILAACITVRLLADDASETNDAPIEAASISGTIDYIDEGSLIANGADALRAFGYNVNAVPLSELDASKAKAKDGSCAVVKVDEVDGKPFITLSVENFMSSYDPIIISECLSKVYSESLLRDMGFTPEQIALSQTQLGYASEALGELNITGYVAGILVSLLMFFCVYFYGVGVANSVSTEKTSRVMETLVVSAKPRSILAGKCVAMGLAGLTQMAGLLLFGIVCVKLLVPSGITLFGMELSLAGLSFAKILAMALYFLLGYALYAMMNAVCGASVSRIEDVNSAMMPVSMISLASFYVGYISTALGGSSTVMETISKYVPLCSPFGMPSLIINNTVSMSEVAISLAILLVTIVLVSILAARLYEAGVLHYGKRLKIKDMLKMKP